MKAQQIIAHGFIQALMLALVVLAVCWVPDGRTDDVKYCENKVTGTIVVVRANQPCPYPTAEM